MTDKSTAADVQSIELGKSLGIREAADLRARLLAAIEAGPVVIDGGSIERADSAGLQLLVSLERSLSSRGELLSYRAVSQPLLDAARILGLSAACRLPDVAASTNAG